MAHALEQRVLLSGVLGSIPHTALAASPAVNVQEFADAMPRNDWTLGQFKGLTWFVEDLGPGRANLWTTDDTEANTHLLAELNTGASPRPVNLTSVGDVAYFQMPTGQGLKLWRSDATASGTGPVDTDRVVVQGSMASLHGLLYFFAEPLPREGADLWQTDGTRDGTRKAAAVKFITRYGEESNLYAVGDYLWFDNEQNFRRDDNLGGIWRSDGTAEGTFQVVRDYTAGQFRLDPDGQRVRMTDAPFVVDVVNPAELHDPLVGDQSHPPYQRNIAVRFFLDADGDGTADPGEGPPDASAFGQLFAYSDLNDDGVFQPALEPARRLGEDGTARIVSVPEGNVVVRAVDPSARFTTSSAVTVAVSAGHDPDPITFGVNKNNRISGTAYEDVNFDGTREAGELPMSGRRVYLDSNGNGVFDEGEPFSLTAEDGTYRFETLPDGVLRAESPPGWRVTENGGGARHVNLAAARDVAYSFGMTPLPPPGTVYFSAFLDYDGDGHQESHEPYVTKLAVGFIDVNGNGTLDPDEPSMRSNGDQFSFAQILPGTYRPGVIGPPGWVVSNADWFSVNSGALSVAPSVGLRRSDEGASISGTVYVDDDFDNARDAAEPGFATGANTVVFLDSDGNGFWSGDPQSEPATVTDLFGRYSFPGLAAGVYRVGIQPGLLSELYGVSARAPSVRPAQVAIGASATGVDIGVLPPDRLSRATGRVYRDVNGNETFDEGDVPVPNVLVYVDQAGNSALDPGDHATLTGDDGRYDVPVLAGWHGIVMSVPAGWVAVSNYSGGAEGVALRTVAGPDFRISPADAAAILPASIAGWVFDDFDLDAARDPFEPAGLKSPGYSGLVMPRPFIDSNGDGVRGTDEPLGVADERGEFQFGGLLPGIYSVGLLTTDAWVQTSPPSDGTVSVTLSAGGRAGPLPFGAAYAPAAVRGTVYVDSNANGTRDVGEPAGENVFLWLDINRNGVYDPLVDAGNATNHDGAYGFAGLRPGSYSLTLLPPPNFVETEPAGGRLTVTVGPAQTVAAPTFGIARVTGSVGGTFFYDMNRDGRRTDNEPAQLGGSSVHVQDVNDAAQSWDADAGPGGRWVVNGLPAGTYRITPDVRNGLLTSPVERVVDVAAGQDVGGADFGWRPFPVRITGAVFRDLDGDGGWGPGDSGFPGITVDGAGSVVTDADGRFAFTDVDPGHYTLSVRRPSRTLRSFPSTGDFIDVFAFTPTQTYEVVPFGLYQPTTHVISGIVFNDNNGNGRRDAGEAAMGGQPVAFDTDHDGEFTLSDQVTTTDSDGWYAFTNFDARSQYRVRLLLGQDRVGTLPANGGWQVVPGGSPTETYGDVDLGSRDWAVVVGRQIFFTRRTATNAGISGGSAMAAADDIVPSDKSVLIPGNPATFSNITTSAGGIDGIAIDVAHLPTGAGITFTPDDFEFRAGARGDPDTWAAAAAPASISVRRAAGADGSDRLVLVWPDGAIQNTWLRVTIKPTINTGVKQPDIFFVGNLAGEAGGPTPVVNATDLARTRANLGNNKPAVLSTYDFNGDGLVNAADVLIVRKNQGHSLSLLTPPLAGLRADSILYAPASRSPTRPNRRGLLAESPSNSLVGAS